MAASSSELNLVIKARNLASNQLKTIGRDFDMLDRKSSVLKKGFAALKKVAVVGLAVVAGAALKAVSAFTTFEDKLNSSLAIMGDVSDEMRGKMSDAAREVGKTTRIGAAEAAEAYFFLASAGLDAAQSIAALPQVAAFAQAGMFDMSTATDLATDAQSALGLTVKDAGKNLSNLTRVTDVLVKANTLANASVEQFSISLTNKAGTALKLVNKDIEEGIAVLAVFADKGVKGQVAGELLSRALKGLQINANKNTAAFDEMDIAVFGSDENMRNMADIVEDLTGAFEGLSDKQKTQALLDLGFTARQQDVIKMLIGTEDQIRKYEAAARDSAGVTKEIADKQLVSAAAKFDLFKSKVEDAAISLGEKLTPKLLDAAKGVEALVEWFQNLGPSAKIAVKAIGAIAAALLLLSVASPAIAALALVAAGIVAIGAAASENISEVGQLTDELNTLGEITVETIENVIGSDSAKDIEILNKLGLSLSDVKDALEENAFSSGKATFAFLQARTSASLLDGSAAGLQEALIHLQNQFNDATLSAVAFQVSQTENHNIATMTNKALSQNEEQLSRYTFETKNATTAQIEMAESQLGEFLSGIDESTAVLTTSMYGLYLATKEAADAQRDLTSAFIAANDPALNLLKAGRDYDQALKDLKKTQGDSKASTEDLEGANLLVVETFEKLIGVAGTFEDNASAVNAFRDMARLAGVAEDDINDMIGVIEGYNALQIPTKVFSIVSRGNPYNALPKNLGGQAVNPWESPRYHRGGVVPGRRGQEVTAILEAGERVIPAAEAAISNTTIASGNSSGGNTTVEVHLHGVDLTDPARRTLQRIREGLRDLDLENQ